MQLDTLFNKHDKFTNKDYSNFDHSKVLPRHRWYHFKEGFSPLVVEEAIDSANLGKDDLIIDPFAGSGTVPLVASSLNYNSIGFEVNPFLAFVANAKQSKINPDHLKSHVSTVLDGINKGAKSNLEGFSTFTEDDKNSKWLFNIDVIRSFEGGWQATENLPREIKKLFRLSLISSVMNNSNAKKDGKCLRYKKNWQDISYNKTMFHDDFLKNIDVIHEDIETYRLKNKGKLVGGDVRKKINNHLTRKFKLCITSPPYLNSFDYTDIYRPELFLGKFVNDNKELNDLRLKTIRSHVQINCRKELLWNNKIPLMVQAYFEDMDNLLTKLKHKAHDDASLWIIVSTSAYAGVEIPVDLILADIGSKIGWNLEEVIVSRHLRNSNQNAIKWNNGEATSGRLRESIVIFKGVN
jgi:DNA modification methylase